MVRRRSRRGWPLFVLTAVMLGLMAPPAAQASCVGPQVSIGVGDGGAAVAYQEGTAVSVTPGDPLTVTGEWFMNGCNDTSSVGTTGCGGPVASQGESEMPMCDVELLLTQGDRTWSLGTTDAANQAENFPLALEATLPTDLAGGAAMLTVGAVRVQLQVDDDDA